MVFIVKIPGRSRANTPEPATATATASTPSDQHLSAPPLADIAMDTPPRAAPPTSITVQPAQDVTAASLASSSPQVAAQPSTAASVASTAPGAAQLDILLAPAVLNHRYVRGVDKSLIVERPERIRAVLLGIATAIGKSTTDDHPAIPSLPSTYPAAAPGPAVSDDDDLVARLGSLSMQAKPDGPQQQHPPPRFRVLHSTSSVPLNPAHPAVAYTHAHADELVAVLESAYDLAKQRRRDTHTAQVKHEAREDTPTPAQPQPEQAASLAAPQQTSHAAYLELLCSRAPNHPPVSQVKHHHSSPSKHPPEDSEAYTSSDGEGDEAMHASEVPEHLPQGDLYLAGPSQQPDSSDGGSAQAIQHAMGACCEAVDRVVAAATSSANTTPLREIRYDQALPHTNSDAHPAPAPAPAAKRAFVLSRPPGHHCSGSTPQGFCWVNNAVVASAHAYLQHGIDRIVVFDIDLHHGNGTQNLAWRINADANKRDDERAERIASLRAAALERARQALGSGTGRAHASRLAKVALSEQDEADIRVQAGPRAMRMFYSSLHDIESFPCEDGDASMIKDASTCVEGAHGQWIWNVHLDHYRSEAEFKRLYADKYAILFNKAARFLQATCALPGSTLVLISAGFDACAYEYPGMQRHGKHVPPSFYHTFARDAVGFADTHAHGKLISVLEGGYSDRALCSAALAHVTGLAAEGAADPEAEAEFWKLDNLVAVEKVAKKMAAHAAAVGGGVGVNITPKRRQAELVPWLARTSRAFAAFEQACGKAHVLPLTATGRTSAVASAVNSPSVAGRTLRDRGALKTRGDATPQSKKSPSKSPTKPRATASHAEVTPVKIERTAMDLDTSTPTKPRAAQDGNLVETTVTTAESTPTKPAPIIAGAERVARADALDISSFLATSSSPQSPVLSAAPVTLVDAMSPTHILDANSTHSIIPLDYLDPDAPGSPDPTVDALDYFPPQPRPKPDWTQAAK